MKPATLHAKLQRTPLPTKVEAIIETANKLVEAGKRFPEFVNKYQSELESKLEDFAK